MDLHLECPIASETYHIIGPVTIETVTNTIMSFYDKQLSNLQCLKLKCLHLYGEITYGSTLENHVFYQGLEQGIDGVWRLLLGDV